MESFSWGAGCCRWEASTDHTARGMPREAWGHSLLLLGDQGRGRAGVRPANVAGLPLKFRGGRGRGRERLVTRREAKVVLQWERFKRMYEQKGRSQWSVTTQKRVKGASGEERSQRWWRGLIHSFHKYLLGATSCQSLWLLRKMHGEYGRALFFTGNTFEGP